MSKVFDTMIRFENNGESCVLVTVVEKKGDGPVEVGKKMVVSETGEAFGTVGGGQIEYVAREICKTLLKKKESFMEKYSLSGGKLVEDAKTLTMVCGGVVTLFYEYIGVKGNVYIFGAGHVGQALTNVLNKMNYHITVIDERKAVYDAFSGANVKIHKSFVNYIEEDGIKEDSMIIVCTPSHEHDYNVINKVIELDIKPIYMGMLCSPEKLMDYLKTTYEKFGENIDLKNFYSPIGLDTGGGSPEEIAVSIAAEILAIGYKKTGHKHMRESINNAKYRYWEN